MKRRGFERILAVMLSVMITFTMTPSIAFSTGVVGATMQEASQEQSEGGESSAEGQTLSNAAEQGAEFSSGQDGLEQKETEAPDDSAVNGNEADGAGDVKSTETDSTDTEAAGTESEDAETHVNDADKKDSDKTTQGKVDVKAVSLTNNIVGEVFSNWVNAADDEGMAAKRDASLKRYPLENHDKSYYGNSLRLRKLQGGDEDGPNYLVYRSEYKIFSQTDSQKYTVRQSEDGKTAYVSPAVPASELSGKIGLVFLDKNVGYDNILVFGGEPKYDDGTMSVPLKATKDITVNELFSDGKLAPEQITKAKNSRSATTKSGIGPIEWEKNPSGTNWKGEIKNFDPEWPSPGVKVDAWKLLFELNLNLKFNLDFDITTTGASNGRETKTIAGLSIPVELFNINLDYNLQVKFDETPIHVKGTLKTDFKYGLGTHGATIREFRTKVTISELEPNRNKIDPSEMDEKYYNKNIDFYIGSQISIVGGFLQIKINLYITKINLGPVLSLNQKSNGGCYITAKHSHAPPDGKTEDEFHTCVGTDEGGNSSDGCISLTSKEVYQHRIFFTIDLYFDDWDLNLTDKSEKTVGTTNYYNSLTFKSGFKEGVCPHKFYKVPVRVWLDEAKTIPAPAGMNVKVSETLNIEPAEQSLIKSETGKEGMQSNEAKLFLPYQKEHLYTLQADGFVDEKHVAGSKKQTVYMQAGKNDTVDIILKSDEKIRVKTEIKWNVDVDKKDVPSGDRALRLVLYRKAVGTDDPWVEAFDEDDYGAALKWTDEKSSWNVDDWTVPKFGFKSDKAFRYEYQVRILETNPVADLLDPDRYKRVETGEYIQRHVDAYDNAVGETEQSHTTKYLIKNKDEQTDEAFTTTITGTAVMDVDLNKKWAIKNELDKPEAVYLALQQKPENGWSAKAGEQKVPDAWVTVVDPLKGSTMTLKELKEAENAELVATADPTTQVENTPLAINKVGKLSDDSASANWSLSYTVPKYRKGVKMQFEGEELNSNVIENLLYNEYNVNTKATVRSFGNYHSMPGLALNDDDTSKSANVVNMDPPESNTISGTVRWQKMGHDWWNDVPQRVQLRIYKNNVEISKGSPVTLNKSNYNNEDIWVWTADLDEDYDPDENYSVMEIFPDGSKEWVPVITGLDVYNYRTWYESIQCEAQAVFEGEPAQDELKVSVKEKNGSDTPWNFTLKKSGSWWDRNAEKKKNEVKDVSEYELNAPDVPGYVKVLETPYSYTRPGWGNIFYNFTVYYLKNSGALRLNISKEWDNTDESTAYPNEVEVTVKRDGETIATKKLHRNTINGNWSKVVISEDAEGNKLTRLDKNNHKYVYTVEETPVDGFASNVVMQDDNENDDDIDFTIKNTWVGKDYVNVKGTVKWEGDKGKERFRPETVTLSVINSKDGKDEAVKTIQLPVSGDGKFEAKYLPAKDKDGNELRYSVIESHIEGYTISYDEPTYDEETKTWTCDLTNTLTGYFSMKIKKKIEGSKPDKDETYKFKLEAKKADNNSDDEEVGEKPLPVREIEETPLPMNNDELSVEGEGEKTVEFLFDEDGLYLYSAKEEKGENDNCEYDSSEKMILIARTHNEKTGKTEYKSYVGESESAEDDDSESSEEPETVLPDKESDTVEFINKYSNVIKVEKKWNIDLENKDRPDSITVVLQKKEGDKWEDVKEAELNKDNDWKATFDPDKTDDGSADNDGDSDSGSSTKSQAESQNKGKDEEEKTEYRVRELTEQTALEELSDKIKEIVTGGVSDSYDKVMEKIKGYGGGKYYDALPDSIRKAAEKGEEKLKEELNAKTEDLYDKLLEKMGLSADRIVYDKEDDDADDDAETNSVRYHVDSYTSAVAGGEVDAHITKYKVEYKEDDGNWTITNKAILEIDNIKRWLTLGVDEDDMPDSAWIVLMFQPDAGAVDKAKELGFDIGSVLDFEFPVINPLEGGRDPISIISELLTGFNLDIFKKLIPIKLAIEKVEGSDDDDKDEDKEDWRTKYVVSKYYFGVPMKYKGAELSSEIIRQIIKYVSKGTINLPVSYNPFSNYISIPTKAIQTPMGMTDLDFGGIAEATLNKLKSLTLDDIKNFGPDTLLDSWHLMANVINIKIDWDSDDDIKGTKVWKNDKEEDRPDTLTIHVREKGKTEDIEGGTIELKKEDFKGKDTWDWELDLNDDSEGDDDKDKDKKDNEKEKIDVNNLVVTEEYPADYEYKDKYTLDTNKFDLTNTWEKEKLDTIDISGHKIWDDENNLEKTRPDKIKIHLIRLDDKDEESGNNEGNDNSSGGEDKYKEVEIGSVETSKAGGWKWFFPNIPQYKEGAEKTPENKIRYTIKEDPVESYEEPVIVDENGDPAEYGGYNVKNTHNVEKITVSGTKVWEDDADHDGKRPDKITLRLKADGNEVASQEITSANADANDENTWNWSFADMPKKKNGKEITYTVSEDTVTDYTTQITSEKSDSDEEGATESESQDDGSQKEYKESFKITNKYEPGKTQVNVSKVWDDKDDQDGIRPDSVTAKLYSYVGSDPDQAIPVKDENDEAMTLELSEDNNWTDSFKDLDVMKAADQGESAQKLNYIVKEALEPEDEEGSVITGKDGKGTYSVEILGDAEKGYTITNKHTPEKITVKGIKEWDDDDDRDGIRPKNITLRLMAGEDEVKTMTVSEADNWKWKFSKLPKYADGDEIKYTVEEAETDVITGDDGEGTYSYEIKGDAKEGYTITNKHTPQKLSVEGAKVWDDGNDQDGVRPESVTVHLKANGEELDKTTVSKETENQDGEWEWKFEDLPKNENGREIDYTITEDKAKGYDEPEIEGSIKDGFKIINRHTTETTEVKGEKIWDNNGDDSVTIPSSVTIRLKADGTEVAQKTVTEADKWEWTFDNLPKHKDGEKITYTISEDLVKDYTTMIEGDAENGFVVTNTYIPGKTQVNFSKVWDDENDQDGIRPEQITVKLLADGVPVQDVDSKNYIAPSKENGWTGSFIDLDAEKNGNDIVYTIEEEQVEGYGKPSIGGNESEGFVITNKHTPETVTVRGNKVWSDDDDRDRIRPDSITIHLKGDGKEVVRKTVNAADNWKWDFKNLPKYDKGKEIEYTFKEDEVTAYTTSYEGNAKQGITVTNIHEPDRITLSGEKVWDDADDQDGKRPDHVMIHILNVDEEVPDIKVSEETGWKWEISLLKNKDGAPIEYNVIEDPVDEYTTKIEGNTDDGYFVTNTHIPETISIEGKKVWDDADDQDGARPKSITMRLKANGKEAGSVKVTQADDWAWRFDDVPKYKGGREIEYSFTEDAVSGYTTDITGDKDKGFTVTNKHTPGKTQVNVVKAWNDKGDMDGIRPESVTVKLLADGSDTGQSAVLSEDNQWTAAFKGLDEKKNGKVITYTVMEVLTGVITGEDTNDTYAVSVTGDQIKGYTITNTHTPIRYTITYKMNGGSYHGNKADIEEIYKYGDIISIHEKPVRKGYKFLYWKGSRYQPGDEYTVKEDHTFVAQWKKKASPTDKDNDKKNKNKTKTGDPAQIGIWIALMTLSLIVMVTAVIPGKRRSGK